jgi:aryl-alcohol dehydrogenase-like predicted oxidoreductase
VALAWIMARPSITSAIASATSVEQARELLGSVDLQLTAEEIEALNRVSA